MNQAQPACIGKRGIFFTSIAVLISMVLVVTFASQHAVTTNDQIQLTQAKAESINSVVRELRHEYLPQAIYVATYNAFYAMAEYMRVRGRYFATDQIFNATLKEMVVNGTLCCSLPGSPVACADTLPGDVNDPSKHVGADVCLSSYVDPARLSVLKENNLTKKLSDFENASFRAYRVNTTFHKDYSNMVLQLYQDNWTGPWRLGVNITLNYSVFLRDMTISNSENISTIFTIEGIPDPLYLVESQKADEDMSGAPDGVLYRNFFNATNITMWNVSTLYLLTEWRTYKQDSNASSFLMRFYGKDERSPCCGVESIINPVAMPSVNGKIERPYIDWCYYGTGNRCTQQTTGYLWNVTCMTTEADGTQFFNLAIDTYHSLQYNLTTDAREYLYGAGPPPECPESPFPAT